MKSNFVKRMVCIGLLSASLLGVNSVGVNAEWRHSASGQWQYKNNGNLLKNVWFRDNSNYKWYYFNEDGIMVTNTTINGYVIGIDGAWIQDNSIISSSNSSSTKTVGWQTTDGKKYFYDANGIKLASTWLNVGGKWYYLKADGEMVVGWLNDNGTWYYLNNDGSMAKNTVIDGKFTIRDDGKLIGKNTPDNTIENNNQDNNSNIKNNNTNSNKNDTNKILEKLKEEKALLEKDNSTESVGQIQNIQDRIDTINKDSAYKKMSTSEQQSTLISENRAKIEKLKSRLEQFKKDDSIESKKYQYDIQQEIKDAEDYIAIISKI